MNEKVKSFFFSRFTDNIAIIVLAFTLFLIKSDIKTLDFTNINWIYNLSFDPGTEIISWNYFRHSPWSFPIIGQLEGYDYPTVTGSGMTGIVSPLAIPFKLISNWLPDDFQYFGWWFLLCFILQGLFGLKLLKNISETYGITFTQRYLNKTGVNPYIYILATIFFLIAPPFLHRMGHIHLFSHFFIVAALSYYFDKKNTKGKFIAFLTLTCLAAGVSQYTTVMVMGIALASFTEQWNRKIIPFYTVLLSGLSLVVAVLGIFYMLGNFLIPFDAVQSIGFGSYSANLNTFFNGLGTSKILPLLQLSNTGQYEGMGYLGAGFMLLLLISIVAFVGKKVMSFGSDRATALSGGTAFSTITSSSETAKIELYPLMFMTFLFFFYSLSCNIGLNETVIYQWRYGPLGAKIFESLRASGRFIWMPFYVLMAFGLLFFLKSPIANWLKALILICCLGIQIFDIQSLMTTNSAIYDPKEAEKSTHLKWKPIISEADRVVMFPPFSWSFKRESDFFMFARAASEKQKAITTGYFARRNLKLLKEYEENAYALWAKGDFGENANAIFIGSKSKMWRLNTLVKQGRLLSFEYDDYGILVPPSLVKTIDYLKKLPDCRPLPFDTEGVADFIEKHKNNTIFVTASEEAAFHLDSVSRKGFAKTDATELSKLGFAGAYINIIHKGKTIFEKVDNEHVIENSFKNGDVIGQILKIKKDLKLASGGAYMGKMSKTIIGEKEYSPNQRGLNFVVVNDAFEVVATTHFDTYDENTHAIFTE